MTCRTDRANEANKMFIISYMALLIIPVVKMWSRARGPYGYLRTWNWPITAREISQPYNNNSYVSERFKNIWGWNRQNN